MLVRRLNPADTASPWLLPLGFRSVGYTITTTVG